MSKLLTNIITVRDEDYEVSEIDAATMKHCRKVMTDPSPDKSELDSFVAQKCLVTPKMSLQKVLEMPSLIVSAIAQEAWRLSSPPKATEDESPKKG